MAHRAGFVNIIGSPNVGKSTLMNSLVGERLSIITSKAQTTRHRIKGIVNGEDFQIVYSDTPGVLNPNYKLQENMMHFVDGAFKDADVILMVTDIFEDEMNHKETLVKIQGSKVPVLILINKMDLGDQAKIEARAAYWKEKVPKADVIPMAALHKFNVDRIIRIVVDLLPESPPYFPKDELTDKPVRFFISEIIREKIFVHYKKEIPYSCEVVVEEFKDEGKIIHIRANIMVIRDTQKGILIGHQGKGLKRVGTEARRDIEEFVGKQVFLDLYVKVDKDWRDKEKNLRGYGYNS
jgi:GTP-binding protein Era